MVSISTSPQNPSNCSNETTGCFPAAGAEAIIRKGWLHPHCPVGSAKLAFHSLWSNIRQTDVGPGGGSHALWPNISQTDWDQAGFPPPLAQHLPNRGGARLPPCLAQHFTQHRGGLPPSLAEQNSNEGNLMGDFQRALPKGQIVSKGTS